MLNINEVRERFGIETDNIEEIRKILIKQQAKLHPDNNSGEFKSQADRDLFSEIDDIIKKIDDAIHTSTDLMLHEKVNKLSEDFYKVEYKINAAIASEELSKTTNNLVHRVEAKYRPYIKISAIISSILVFVWAFPTVVTEHPVIKEWGMDINNVVFTNLWLVLMIIFSCAWIYFTILERIRINRLFKAIESESEDFIRYFLEHEPPISKQRLERCIYLAAGLRCFKMDFVRELVDKLVVIILLKESHANNMRIIYKDNKTLYKFGDKNT